MKIFARRSFYGAGASMNARQDLAERPNDSVCLPFPEYQVALARILAAARKALRNPGISARDNPSALLRDLRKICVLVRDIERTTGIQIPITTFSQAQSFDELAQMLAGGRIESAMLLPLSKRNGEPLFLLPGLAGSVAELLELADAISHDGPVYAVAYPALDGRSEAATSIPELAQRMFEAVQTVWRGGRLHLVGYSLGGTIAIEMARRLSPDTSGLLALIDPGLPESRWPLAIWLRFLLGRPNRAAGQVGHAPRRTSNASGLTSLGKDAVARMQKRLQAIRRAIRGVARHIHQRYGSARSRRILISSSYYVKGLPSYLQAVRDGALLACARHDYKVFTGDVVYFRSVGSDSLSCDPEAVWPDILPAVRFVKLPGSHSGILQRPLVESLAASLSSEVGLASKANIAA